MDTEFPCRQPGAGMIRDELLEPLIRATCATLSVVAGSEASVRAVGQEPSPPAPGDVVAVVTLRPATDGPADRPVQEAGVSGYEQFLVLRFPEGTAAALAGRILADVTEELDQGLVRDCMGELANVVAGQVKALLAGGPNRFSISIPEVLAPSARLLPADPLHSLVLTFTSDHGEFVVQLFRPYQGRGES
jgi:CheY-specific phosphatase CheX